MRLSTKKTTKSFKASSVYNFSTNFIILTHYLMMTKVATYDPVKKLVTSSFIKPEDKRSCISHLRPKPELIYLEAKESIQVTQY